ncbi:hypothetical protein N9N03_00340 [Chlamydiia bacterium]|nr:hypothetical protein [Chlamydiia bacterium]
MIANSKRNELVGEFTGMQPRLEITEHHLEEIKFHGINTDDKELDRCLDRFLNGIEIDDETEITEHHLEEIKFYGINADDKELDRCLDTFFEGIRISDEMERKCCNAENLQIDLQKQSETLKKIEDSLAREDLSFNPK